MIRHIIEYLRKENGISTIDLTLDICSPSMYYAYIKGTKQISEEKLILLKDRLGADNLSYLEFKEYNQELDEYCDCVFNLSYTHNNIINFYEILEDYRIQMLLDERLVVKYLVVMIQLLIILDKTAYLDQYLNIFSLIKDYLTKEQLIYFYAAQTYDKELSYQELIDLLVKIEDLSKDIPEESCAYGFVYMTLGKMYLRTHKHYYSRSFIEKAIEYYRKKDCFRGIVASKNVYILNLLTINKVGEAVVELEKNLFRANELNFLEEIKNCLTYQLLCYGLQKKVDQIIINYKKMLELLNKGIMNNDYLRLLYILGVLDKFNLEKEVKFLTNFIQSRLPPPSSSFYRDLLKCFTIHDEEEKMYHIELVLERYEDIFCGYDWRIQLYCKLINYYENQRKYKKVAEISNKYIIHLQKYVQ